GGGRFTLPTGAVVTTSGAGSLVINAATLTIDGSLTVPNDLTLTSTNAASGTIAGAGTVTLSGHTTWTGGAISGTGTTVVRGGLTLGAPGASTRETLTGRELDNFAAASLVVSGGLNNSLLLGLGATFHNEPGASFAFAGDASVFPNNGAADEGTFVNEGTLAKT